MTDLKPYLDGFELLEKRFPNESIHRDIRAMYLQYFQKNLTPEEFLRACKYAIIHHRTLQPVSQLVEYIQGDKDAGALQDWQAVLAISARAAHQELTQLPPELSARARVALKAVGGCNAIALADETQRKYLKLEFLKVYKQTRERDLQSLPPVPVEPPRSAPETVDEGVPMPGFVKRQLEEAARRLGVSFKSTNNEPSTKGDSDGNR